jgi:Protein of unknown function (DUF3618)
VNRGKDLRHGGEPRKSAAEIEEEIRRIRTELGLTLDSLAYQLAPRELVEKGIDMIVGSIKGNGVVRFDLGEAVRANRLPLALIGAGVAWMIARNFPTADATGRGDAASGKGGDAWLHRASGAARGMIRSVGDSGGAVLERAEQFARYAGDHANERARRAGGSLREAFERNPLLIGLAGLVSGAVLAALLPATKREQEWVGATRDELREKAEEIGHEAADRLRNLAEHKTRQAEG